MLMQIFPSGPFETNAIVLACSETRLAVIVDPSPGSAEPINAYLAKHQLNPIKILLTHSHWDHIADVAKLKVKWPIPVAIHPEDVPNLERPGSDGLPALVSVQGVKPDQLLADGDLETVGSLQLQVIHTPGHSPGSVCFYEPSQKILLTGDTLFKGSIGNLSFPTSTPDDMWPSLEKIKKLPLDTRIYPGHGPDTVLSKESWLNQAKSMFGY